MTSADKETIPVLWFNRLGFEHVALRLQLHPFKAELEGEIPASLGLRILAGDVTGEDSSLIGGGFNLCRESAAELYRQIGEWLQATPIVTAPSTSDTRTPVVTVTLAPLTGGQHDSRGALTATIDLGTMEQVRNVVRGAVTDWLASNTPAAAGVECMSACMAAGKTISDRVAEQLSTLAALFPDGGLSVDDIDTLPQVADRRGAVRKLVRDLVIHFLPTRGGWCYGSTHPVTIEAGDAIAARAADLLTTPPAPVQLSEAERETAKRWRAEVRPLQDASLEFEHEHNARSALLDRLLASVSSAEDHRRLSASEITRIAATLRFAGNDSLAAAFLAAHPWQCDERTPCGA